MLSLQNIHLNFSQRKVLNDISVTFEDGKIYSILGENGTGKSTLGHIICGDRKPSAGKIFLNGEKVSFRTPRKAIQKGICCVHQRPLLSKSVSIYENLIIGLKKIDEERIDRLVNKFLPNRKKTDIVGNITPAEHFFVSMIGALLKNPKILILDEPSALLSYAQRIFLFNCLKSYAKKGMTIIVVSHFISESIEKSDRIILIRDGRIILNDSTQNLTENKIKEKLYDNANFFAKNDNWPKNLPIEFVHDIDEKKIKRISTDGKKVGIIPSDRTFRGSNPGLSILQLLVALHTDMPEEESIKYAEELVKKAQVNVKLNEKAYNLSGGMLQRLILQREIAEKPDILVLCEPRQGLDTAAVKYLFSEVADLCNQGVKVIVQEAIS